MKEIEIYVWDKPESREERIMKNILIYTLLLIAGIAAGYLWSTYQGQI